MNVIAVIAFRNEQRFLPGFFRHLRGYVDGIICLNDCSTDLSPVIVEEEPQVLKVLNAPCYREPHACENKHRRILLSAAAGTGAKSILCCDADERFEKAFLVNLRSLAAEHRNKVCCLRSRDLWNSPDHYRIDGAWARKGKAVLFESLAPHNIIERKGLHQPWYPNVLRFRQMLEVPYNIYHLRSILPADREARVAKFKGIDPTCENQPLGYDYLSSEVGLELQQIPQGKEYET